MTPTTSFRLIVFPLQTLTIATDEWEDDSAAATIAGWHTLEKVSDIIEKDDNSK